MKNSTKGLNMFLLLALVIVLGTVVYLKVSFERDLQQTLLTKQVNHEKSFKINSISNLKSKSEEARQVATAFDQFYIDRANILEFIELIEGAAVQNNLDLVIENVAIDETHLAEPVPHGYVNMVLTAQGGLAEITRFLSDLEKLAHLIDFGAVRLTQTGNGASWSVNVAIKGLTN